MLLAKLNIARNFIKGLNRFEGFIKIMAKKYTLPELPYPYNALEPYLSEEILRVHHDKHHLAYVNGANAAIEKLEKARTTGEVVDFKAVARDLSFNLSGHILHSIYWENMSPKGGGKPGGILADRIDKDLGGFENFKAQLSSVAATVEGSGWGLLAYDPEGDRLIILQIEKHNNQLVPGAVPLLVLDTFEHAYYLQYKNDRKAYIDAWWNIVNWSDVERRLTKVL